MFVVINAAQAQRSLSFWCFGGYLRFIVCEVGCELSVLNNAKRAKTKKTDWSESEVMVLAEAVVPHMPVLKGNIPLRVTSE